MAWQYGSETRQVISGTHLRAHTPEADDQDQDGLSDTWEIANGLDATKGYGAHGYAGDVDADGILNYVEAQVGTSPINSDTDGDGYDDWFEINELLTDPTVAEAVEWVQVQEIDGAAASFLLGDWSVSNGTAVCRSAAGGELSFAVEFAADGIYQLSCDFTRLADSHNSKDQPIVLLWYLDDEYLGKTVTEAESGTINFSEFKRTPHLLAGEHSISLRWINVYRDHKLAINNIKVEEPTAPTPEALSGWIDESVQQFASVDSLLSDSLVSPLSVEGRGRYLSGLEITPATAPIRAGLGRWYADVPLNPTGATGISFSFQDGGHVQTASVQWLPTNVFEHEQLRIRAGDALKLAAIPTVSTGGSFEILVDGQSQATGLTAFIEYVFENPGVHQVTGVYTASDGSETSSSLAVEVVGLPSDIAPVAIWSGRSRTWALPGLPEDVSIEAEGMFISNQGENSYQLIRDEPYEDISIIARMDATGAILSSIPTRAFSLRATVEGYLGADRIDESTREVENEIFTFGLPEEVDVEINVFKAGVILDDGTRQRLLSVEDFNELGGYSFYMIKPDSVGGGSCHRIHAHQGAIKIGTR